MVFPRLPEASWSSPPNARNTFNFRETVSSYQQGRQTTNWNHSNIWQLIKAAFSNRECRKLENGISLFKKVLNTCNPPREKYFALKYINWSLQCKLRILIYSTTRDKNIKSILKATFQISQIDIGLFIPCSHFRRIVFNWFFDPAVQVA